MTATLSRRGFVRSFIAGVSATVVVGFDPKARSWVTQAMAQGSDPIDHLPPLDGELLLDDATLEAFADDWGHDIHRRPLAVLKPGSVHDVVRIVRFANRHCLKVAMRGQGHATFGNAQVCAGVVVDSNSNPLNCVRVVGTGRDGHKAKKEKGREHDTASGWQELIDTDWQWPDAWTPGADLDDGHGAHDDPNSGRWDERPRGPQWCAGDPVAQVGPGALWGGVWDAADAVGLRTPVTTDVNVLTVGGTLSMGGLGGTTFDIGMQVDHVLQLKVVTGRGHLVTCSRRHHQDLFNAILGGQGQCGIIVEAVVVLVPAPTHVNFYRLTYTSLDTFVHDQLFLARTRRFTHMYGRSVARPGGGFNCVLEVGAFYNAPDVPDEAALLAGLRFTSMTLTVMTHKQYYDRGNTDLQALRDNERYFTPHSWFQVFVPQSKFLEFARAILNNPTEVQFALPRMAPYRTSALTAPLMRVPMNEEFAYALLLARNPPPDVPSRP